MADSYSSPLRQGDILQGIVDVPELSGADASIQKENIADGVVVVSQTCDALRDPRIQVAPIVRLEGEQAAQARVGRRLQYVPLSLDRGTGFADLSRIFTINRGQVIITGRTNGITTGLPDTDSKKFFRALVGHRFARFPFPDEVTEWCRPLTDKVAPKVKHPDTKPEGARLREIKEIRVTSLHGWEQSHFELQLDFLVEPGIVPEPDRDLTDDEKDNLQKMLAPDLACKIGELTHANNEGTSALRFFAWNQLIKCWTDTCNEKYKAGQDIKKQVRGDSQLWDLDEYPYSRVLRSERLDLDYLSRSCQIQQNHPC
jgi:hypothetical protein